MADTKVTGAQSTPAFIEKIDIFSTKDPNRSVSVVNGTVQVMYYESLLQDTIVATVLFTDTGDAIDEKSAVEGLPIVASEKVLLKIKDNNDVQLDLTLYNDNSSSVGDQTTKGAVSLRLVSKEFLLNDEVSVNKRLDGKISDSVKTLLTEFLETEKDVSDIEESNNLNVSPKNWKPIYTINWLSKQAAPTSVTPIGKTAGYFFFETSEGYKFKSIDTLLSQEKKKSIIYNETPDSRGANIPEGYDLKAITYLKKNKINTQAKLQQGYQSTKLTCFNLRDCTFDVYTFEAKNFEQSLKLGGKELPTLNPELNREGKNKQFSRQLYRIRDTGTLPSGDTKEQIAKAKEENYVPEQIECQSIMRYNQLYTTEIEITIPGDFSLHAGDAVYFDAPSPQKDTKNDDIDRQIGGLYIISALCHLVNSAGTYTKLNLVRDSVGRTGKAKDPTSQSGKPATPTSIPGVQPSVQRKSFSSTSTF